VVTSSITPIGTDPVPEKVPPEIPFALGGDVARAKTLLGEIRHAGHRRGVARGDAIDGRLSDGVVFRRR
jgi:hypothetical protein